MIENLLLTNLFLVANSLITISFILFAFLHLDLFIKSKKPYALYMGLGGIVLGLSFASGLFLEIKSLGFLKDYIILSLQFVGLLLIALGYIKEVELKTAKKKTSKVRVFFFPFFVIFLFLFNFLLAAFITSKNMHKLHFDTDEKIKPLLSFWFLITFIFFLNFVSFFSGDRFSFVEISLSKYSFMWVMLQLSLLVAFVLMYKWVRSFLHPKTLTKIVFDVWSFAIFLCILITSLFLTLSMPNYESEIFRKLEKNVDLVESHFEQMEKSNKDLLKQINFDLEEDYITSLVKENIFVERVLLLNAEGQIIYGSEGYDFTPDEELMEIAFFKRGYEDDYYMRSGGVVEPELSYKAVQPLFLENNFLGTAISIKSLDSDFLTYLNLFTGREFLLLDSRNNILASVLNQNRLSFDDTVRIERVKYLNEEGYIFMEIDKYPYLGSVIEVKNRFGDVVANLVVLDSYNFVASTVENSMYLISFYALVFSMVSFVPSYFFARRLNKMKCLR